MELLRNIAHIKSEHCGCVATIGNFDGAHLGHRAIIKQLREQADQLNLPLLVITFEPQAREFFSPAHAPGRLSNFREKYTLLKALGVDRLLCLRFNQQLANLSAKDFIEGLLVKALGIKYLVVGEDFRFGHKRQGDVQMLRQAGKDFDFVVKNMPRVDYQGERISSSRVRLALQEGDFVRASEMLGRSYTMQGRVFHGEQRGREIGFPTANIPLRRCVSPLQGVYVVQVHGLGHKPLQGVASVGVRPMFDEQNLLEVHLFDFDKSIYRKTLTVEFLQRIREQEQFSSLEILTKKITEDVEQAKQYFVDKGL